MMETRRLVGYAGLLAGLLLGLTALLGACVASPSAGEARQKLTEEGGVRTRPATATLMPLESAPTRSPAPVKTVPPTLTVVADAEPPERSIRLTATVPPGVERVPAMTPSALIGEVPHDLMANLFDDVVARSEGEREAIEIVRAEAVVWRDGSLGCPQPGMMYTMALVNGYWVVLRVDRQDYDYRLTASGFFVLCERELSPLSLPDDAGGGAPPNE